MDGLKEAKQAVAAEVLAHRRDRLSEVLRVGETA